MELSYNKILLVLIIVFGLILINKQASKSNKMEEPFVSTSLPIKNIINEREIIIINKNAISIFNYL